MSVVTEVRAALDEVYDPCSQAWQRPLSVADLGLVRSVEVTETGVAAVVISPTTLLCMAISVIIQAIELKVAAVPGVRAVRVTVDVETEWTDALMTEQGRQVLAAHRLADRGRTALAMPGFGVPVPSGAS